MIKPKELMIGNYLQCGKSTVEVAIISENHFDCITVEDGMFIPNGIYNPIQLTKEWLVKFGFEIYGKYTYLIDFLLLENIDEYWSNSNLRIKIQYVHQLQNLYFALTGDNLKIKEE